MRLSVKHVTRYVYDQPVRAVVQSHRLTPARCAQQTVISWDVTVTNGTRGAGFRDGAGDWVQGYTVAGPVSEVAVTVAGTIETTDTLGLLSGLRERIPPTAWLSPTALTLADEPVRALSEQAATGTDALSRAHALAAAVSTAVRYAPGETDAATTAAQALELGRGVCQDHAHVLIAAAHCVDIPARYVSGYLFATEDGQMHEAAHAWAELWVDGLGWVGFDPANRCCPDERYIRLGCGVDAQGAAPIRGIARGLGRERMEIDVAISAAQQ